MTLHNSLIVRAAATVMYNKLLRAIYIAKGIGRV